MKKVLPSKPEDRRSPSTLNPQLLSIFPNLKPQTLNPTPQTPNPKPQTPKVLACMAEAGTHRALVLLDRGIHFLLNPFLNPLPIPFS